MFRNRIDRWFAAFQRHGDARALARVFDRAAPELWRVASYLCRDRHVAEDAVQSAFLAAIEARHEWDPVRPLMPWLLGLLANRVREERRRNARRPQAERVAVPRAERDPAAAAASQELDETLRSALARIGEPYRSTLEQHLVHGLSATEIAARDGVPAATARMRLHRGLERLRDRLPKGLVAGGVGALLLTPESMAAMRTPVLAKASTIIVAAGAGGTAGAAVIASSPGKKALLGFALLLLGALTLTLATRTWTAPQQPGAAPPAVMVGPAERTVANVPVEGAIDADEGGSARAEVAARTGELRVVVLTRGGLEPVRGAELAVFPFVAEPSGATPIATTAPPAVDVDRREATTDADGVATFELPAGPARVELRAPSVEAAAVTVRPGDTVEQVLLASIPFHADLLVVDASGTAFPGARIVARRDVREAPPDETLGETGGDGRWRGTLPLGVYVVRAVADGRASSGAALVSRASASATLMLGGTPATLLGTVRDRDGRPVGGAGIALQPAGGASSGADACHVSRTDADGRYAFGYLAPGDYTIYAWHGERDARRIARTCTVAVAAQPTIVDVTIGDGARIEVELTRPGGRPWVRAGFRAAALEQPVRGIEIARFGLTDERGRLDVAGLPAGRYELEATVEHEVVRETVDVRDGEPFVFRRVIGPGAWLEVRLTDADGAPLPDWWVYTNDRFAAAVDGDALWPRLPPVQTDARGVARFEDLPDRPTWITVSRGGVRVPVLIAEVPHNARATCVLTAAQLAGRRVSGRIAAHDLGDDAAFAASLIPQPETPVMFARGLEAAVGADGSFRFDGVPPGTYGLSVVAHDRRGEELGRVAWRRGIEVASGHDVDLGAIAASLADLPVHLLRSDGVAVAHPRLVLRLGPGQPFQSWPQDLRGDRVALQRLPAGTQDVLALGDDCAPTAARVTAPDAGRGAAIVVDPAATVTVRCDGLTAANERGSWRVFRDDRLWFAEDVVDVRQPYRIGLPPGRYRVAFVPASGTRAAPWVAEFAVGREAVEVVAR